MLSANERDLPSVPEEGPSIMSISTIGLLIPVGLFVGTLLCLYIGLRLGQRKQAKVADSARVELNVVDATVFGLMGLYLAFTFFGAAQRYELRRQLTVEEANAIGTSYLRLDLLPISRQAPLREKYRRYVESRLAVYRVLPDIEASTEQATIATGLQQEIWGETIAAL